MPSFWSGTNPAFRISLVQRRRSERAPGQETLQEVKERIHKRWSWSIGAVLTLTVVGVLAAGYYQEFYRPPRVWAGKVNDVEFTMGDLVRRIRMEQGLVGKVDLSKRPFDYLRKLLDAELLRQEAPELGINVTDELVEGTLRAQFYPTTPAGQVTDPGQLDQEYRNNLQIFLTRAELSDSEYRGIVEENLRLAGLHNFLARDIPETQEQVEVAWIRLDPDGPVRAAEVMVRLQNEEFASVARKVGVSQGYADSSGYVGWLPRTAFPEVGRVVFGDPKSAQPALGVGEIGIRPIITADDVYIVRKLSGPEMRPLSDTMRAKVNAQRVIEWQDQQLKQGLDQGWVKMQLNSRLYEWVTDQVLISAPRYLSGQR